MTLGNDLSTSLQESDGEETADQASVDGAGEEDDGGGEEGDGGEEEEESSTVSVAASLALNVTNADTRATLAANRSLNASGVSILVKDNTDSKVVSNGGTAGADSNLGAALALNIVDVDLEASIKSGASIESSGDVEISVSSLGVEEEDEEGATVTDETSTFTTAAVAGAGQGNLSLAGAVAINVVDVEAQAKVLENADVTTTGSGNFTISTSTNTAYETFGEGISGGVTMPTIEDAKAKFLPFDKLKARVDGYTTSVGGAIDTAIADAQAANEAAASLEAESEAESEEEGDGGDGGGSEDEEEEETSSSIGIGAAFAINIVHETILANIARGASVTVAGDLAVTAGSSTETATEASAGAGPEAGALDDEETEAVGYSLDAAVALNYLNRETEAKIYSDTQTLTVGGDVVIEASSETSNETLAHGEAAGEKAAVGASVAVSIVIADTEAHLGRNLTAGGELRVAATSDSQDISDAKATARGLLLEKYANKYKSGMNSATGGDEILGGDFSDSEGNESGDSPHSVQALGDHGAKTQSADKQGKSDSGKKKSISVAAAVGVNALDYDVRATTADGLNLSVGEDLEVSATNNTNYNSRGTGIAILTDNAIAVGVGVVNTLHDTRAKIGAGTTITQAEDITVEAASTQNQSEDFVDKLAAEGVAGAGAKKLGVAGALALVNNINNTEAQVGAGTTITNADGLTVKSTDLSRLRVKAWGASVAVNGKGDSKAAIGAAFAIINTVNDTEAEIGNNSSITVTNGVTVLAENLRQSENDFDFSGDFKVLNPTAFFQTTNYYTEAVGVGAATGDNALAGSFGVIVSHNDIHAKVGENVTLSAGSFQGKARNRTNARSLTGGVAAAQKLAIGGTVSALIFRDKVSAIVARASTLQTSGNVGLGVLIEQDIGNVALAGSLATSENAIAGAAGINVFDNRATVEVGVGSSLSSSGGDVELLAKNDTRVLNFTGQGSYGGKTGVGGVLSLNLFLNETTTTAQNNSTLNASGQLSLIADSVEDILNAALGVTGGGDNALAGTLGLNIVKTLTKAEVKSTGRLNHGNDSAGTEQSLAIKAISDTDIAEFIGAGALGGNNGIGGSLDTNVIWKTVSAKIDGTANADTLIQVVADVEQDVSSATVGFAGSNSTAVAGAGSIGLFKNSTEAVIGENATVVSDGHVQVHAEDETDLVQLTGSASVSSSNAFGGAIGVSTFIGSTIARIEDQASVTALGKGTTMDILTGEVTLSSQLLGNLSTGNVEGLRSLVEGGLSGKTVSVLKDSLLGETRNTESHRGLSVTAYSNQDMVNIASAASGGGSDTAAGNVAATVVLARTEAFIGDADINTVNTGAHGDQDVVVRASGKTRVVDFSGALAAGGGNALGGAGDVVTLVKTTKALIKAGASVSAANDVVVEAKADEWLLSVAAGFAGGGSNTVGGSAAVGVMVNETLASIQGNVSAGGDLSVEAEGDSQLIQVAGSISIGGGTAGVGAALGVSVFKNTTKAFLGDQSVTNAGGLTKVAADSNETFYGITVAGAGGGTAGVAGALSIRVHDSTTKAYVENHVNQNNAYAASGQSVLVRARNEVRELGVTGGLAGGGTVGVGLGADVLIIRNQANAFVGNNARVKAYDDIKLEGTSKKDAQSYVLAFGGGGTVGVAGSVSVMAIGSIVDSDSRKQLSGEDGSGGSGSAWTAADGRTGSSQVGGELGTSSEATESKGTLDAQNGKASVAGSFDETTVLEDRTQAFIGNGATVDAGRDIIITARETTKTRIGAGSIAGGGSVSVGGSIGIALIDNSAEAFIGKQARVNAARFLDITAQTKEDLYTIGVAGGGAAYVAVNGTIINQTILSDTLAFIDNGALINTDDDEEDNQRVSVKAESESSTFSLAGDGGGAIAGIGASANVTTFVKKTKAFIGQNAQVNAEKDIFVDALSQQNLMAITVSAQGGAAGIGGVVSPQTLANRTEAFIDRNATVVSKGNVRVQASDDSEIDSIPLAGQVGGVTVGGALGLNTITSTTRALINEGATVRALGTKGAMNVYNSTISTTTADVLAKTTTSSDGQSSESTSYTSSELARGVVSKKGLAVIAQSNQDIFNTPVGFSASAGNSYSATAAVHIVATTTEAKVADNVIINSNNGAAGTEQGVSVGAFDRTDLKGITITGAISSGGTNTLAAHVDVLKKTVRAELGGTVKAKGNITVEAIGEENLDVSVMDAGIAQGVGVGGSVGVSVIKNSVMAAIRSNADVETAKSLRVEARDNSSLTKIVGRAGAGGVAAVGAGVGVDVISNRVTASIGPMARTDASNLTRVAAHSRERFNGKTVAGSLGGGLALAGSFGVKVDQTTTQAFIGNEADINQTSSFSSSTQDVEVLAHNDVSVNGLTGAGAISLIASVGLGADITIIRNTTTAYVGQDGEMNAGGDVRVTAESVRDIRTMAIAGAGGLGVGVAGSLNLVSIGAKLDDQGKGQLSNSNGNSISSIEGESSRDYASDHNSGEKGSMATSQHRTTHEDSSASTQTSGLGSYLNESSTASLDKTRAYVGSRSRVTASGDITLRGRDSSKLNILAGGAALGAAALGGWFAVGISNTTAEAFSGDNVTLDAGGDILVESQILKKDNQASQVEAIGGSVGLLGFAGSVALLKSQSEALAYTGASNTLVGEKLFIKAKREGDLDVDVTGGSAGIYAAGAAISRVEISGGGQARLGTRTTAGTTTRQLDHVTIETLSIVTVDNTARAGAVGVGAAAVGAEATTTDTSINTAQVGDHAVIRAARGSHSDVLIQATHTPQLSSTSHGTSVSGGVAVGISKASVTESALIQALTGNHVSINVGDDFLMTAALGASSNGRTADSQATGTAGGLAVGAGATEAFARVNAQIIAQTGGDQSLSVGDELAISASDEASAYSDVSGLNVGLLAFGYNNAESRIETITKAILGASGAVQVGGRLFLGANSTNILSSDSEAGAGGLGAALASQAKTVLRGETRAQIADSGAGDKNEITSGETYLHGRRKVTFDSRTDSFRSSAIGSSGAMANNNITSFVSTDMGAHTHLVTGDLSLLVENVALKNLFNSNHVRSGSGGALDIAAARAVSRLTHQTKATFGDGVDIDLAESGDSSNGIDVQTFNSAIFNNQSKLESGGAITVAGSTSESIYDSTGDIRLGQNVAMDSLGDITLGSRTVADIKANTRVKTFGFSGAAEGTSIARVTVNQNTVVGQNSHLRAEGDVALRAGSTDGEETNELSAVARTYLWNKTVIPIKNEPDADALITQNNRVTVQTGAIVEAVHDVIVEANRGEVRADGYGEAQDSYRQALQAVANGISRAFGGGKVSFAIKSGSSRENSQAGLHLEGTLRASIENQEELVLGKRFHGYDNSSGGSLLHRNVERNSQGQWEVKNGGTVLRNLTPDTQTEGITWEFHDHVNLAAQTNAEISRLTTLRNSYSLSPNIQASLQAEINRLVLEQRTIPSGAQVQVLELGNVAVRTGDIHLLGDYVQGGGKLVARGDAQIHITNNSPTFLNIHNLEVPHGEGGYIFMNNIRVESNNEINMRGQGGTGSAAFTITDRGDTAVPSILITHNFDPSNPIYNVDNLPGLIAPDIRAFGEIANLDGRVTLFNEAGSIVSSGNIYADTLNITAGEDFVQNYVQGISHTGANPSSLFSGSAGLYEGHSFSLWDSYEETLANTSDYSYSGPLSLPSDSSSTIVANNVFITADILNINGRIQSGLSDLRATITNSAISSSSVTAARTAYNQAVASGQDISSIKYFQLTGSGNDLSEIDSFLNFETDEIELGRAQVQGGLLQLTGKIISTGNGKIEVIDGYGRINVNNQTSKKLVLGQVHTGGDIEGKIIITDIARTGAQGQSYQTIYSRLGTTLKVVDNTTLDSSGNPNNVLSSSSTRMATYNPQTQQRFYWIRGNLDQVEFTDTAITERGLNPDGRFETETRVLTGQGIVQIEDTGHIGTSTNTDDYTFQYTRLMVSSVEDTSLHIDTESCIRRIIGICRLWRRERTRVYNEEWRNIYQHSIHASRPVAIEFKGYDTGRVQVTSQGHMALNGDINNITGDTTLTASGGITQRQLNATLKAHDLTLNANQGALGEEGAPIRLDQEHGGHVNVSARNQIFMDAINGDLILKNINSRQDEKVSISSDDSIRFTGSGHVKGGEVLLVSRSGGIGESSGSLRLNTEGSDSSITAKAVGDIYLHETSGDLRVDRIVSREGNVVLTVDGTLLDANGDEGGNETTDTERSALYNEMRLMGSEATNRVNEAVDNYRRRKNDEYQQYWNIRGFGQAYDSTTRVSLTPTRREQLKKQNSWTDTRVNDYEAQLSTDYHSAHRIWGSTPYQGNYNYTVSSGERNDFTEGSAWSSDELSTTVSVGAAIDDAVDPQAVVEEANIVGANVSLIVNGGVGQALGDLTVTVPASGYASLTSEIKEALRVAEKDDIIFDGNTLTIKRKKDIDVAASGQLEIQTPNDLYLGSEEDLNIKLISSGGAASLRTEGSLGDAGEGNSAVVTGDLVIESGEGAIGSSEQAFRVHTANNASFTARSRENIYVNSSLNNLSIREIRTRESLFLTSSGGYNLYDHGNDEVVDIHVQGITLNTDGDIGGRDSGGTGLGGQNEALDVNIGGDALLNANSTGGIINLHAPDSAMTVGQITAHAGVALHSNSSIEGGVIQVTDSEARLGLVLEAEEEISLTSTSRLSHSGSGAIDLTVHTGSLVMADGSVVNNSAGVIHVEAGEDISLGSLQTANGGLDAVVVTAGGEIQDGGESAHDIIITGTSGQAVLNAGTGIGVNDPLDLNVPMIEINNISGDVNIINVRDLIIGGLSLSQGTGEIGLVSHGSVTLADGIVVTTNGALVSLEASDEISGTNAVFDSDVSLTSHNSSIGLSDQPLVITIDGQYQTLQAGTGIYLEDTVEGLSITTTGEGTDGAIVTATTLGDWEVGSIGVAPADLVVNVGGNSFEADSLEGDSVGISVAGASGSAHIGVVTVADSLDTQVGVLTVDDLQTDASGVLSLSNTGANGGQAQDVKISSDVGNPFFLDGPSTETGTFYFPGSDQVGLSNGDISSNLYLETDSLSFNFFEDSWGEGPADVNIILPPGGELLNFFVTGNTYETTGHVLFSNQEGQGDSILDTADRIGAQSVNETEDRLEGVEVSWYATSDTVIPLVIEGIGVEIDGIELIDFEGEEIRNDFLRTIEIDSSSNAFSSNSLNNSEEEEEDDEDEDEDEFLEGA